MCMVWQANPNQEDLATVGSAASFPLEIKVNVVVMFGIRAWAEHGVKWATSFASDGAEEGPIFGGA